MNPRNAHDLKISHAKMKGQRKTKLYSETNLGNSRRLPCPPDGSDDSKHRVLQKYSPKVLVGEWQTAAALQREYDQWLQCRDCCRCVDLRGTYCTWKPNVILRRTVRNGGYLYDRPLVPDNDSRLLHRNQLKSLYDQHYNEHPATHPAHVDCPYFLPDGPTNVGLLDKKTAKWQEEIAGLVELRMGPSLYRDSYNGHAKDNVTEVMHTASKNDSQITAGLEGDKLVPSVGSFTSKCKPSNEYQNTEVLSTSCKPSNEYQNTEVLSISCKPSNDYQNTEVLSTSCKPSPTLNQYQDAKVFATTGKPSTALSKCDNTRGLLTPDRFPAAIDHFKVCDGYENNPLPISSVPSRNATDGSKSGVRQEFESVNPNPNVKREIAGNKQLKYKAETLQKSSPRFDFPERKVSEREIRHENNVPQFEFRRTNVSEGEFNRWNDPGFELERKVVRKGDFPHRNVPESEFQRENLRESNWPGIQSPPFMPNNGAPLRFATGTDMTTSGCERRELSELGLTGNDVPRWKLDPEIDLQSERRGQRCLPLAPTPTPFTVAANNRSDACHSCLNVSVF